jgi:TRAP-type uncharacterized transport system substrate-binding protein
VDSIRLPTWVRFALVIGLVLITAAAGLVGYRWYTRPTTLSIAVGSLDGEAGKVMTAIAGRLTSMSAPVRLRVVDVPSSLGAAEAFSSNKVDLAVVRGDVGDLSQAQAVAVVAHAAVLIIAPPGSPASSIEGLKRKTVGVVGGEMNQRVVDVLKSEYDLGNKVTFKNLAPPEARRALESKEVNAIMIVVPLTERYLALVRGLFSQNAKTPPVLIPIESAGAIAETQHAYESFDVPKGTLRGAPPVPDDDLTTLRTTFYLVAHKKLDPDLIADFTKSLMSAKRDLMGELPILAQVAAADTDPGAYLPVHPGAAEYYNGTQQSFMDKWSNAIFLTPMALGALASLAAAAWKFLRIAKPQADVPALDALYALARRIRKADNEAELQRIEDEIDDILGTQRAKAAASDIDPTEVATLNVTAHRLQNLIHDRRAILRARMARGAAAS